MTDTSGGEVLSEKVQAWRSLFGTPVFHFTCSRPCAARLVSLSRIRQQGSFDEETVAVEIPSKRGPPTIIGKDEEYTNVSMGWDYLSTIDVFMHKRLKCVSVAGLFPLLEPLSPPYS